MVRRRAAPRRAGLDELGLKRAFAQRLLPFLVAAMAFLAALAIAGMLAAASLARHWQEGAGASLTVEVPNPEAPATSDGLPRAAAVLATLKKTPGVIAARRLGETEIDALLRPWLGTTPAALGIAVPGVIALRLAPGMALGAADSAQLARLAAGIVIEDHGPWLARLSTLARSLEACAALALGVVGALAALVVAVATRAGLSARREALEIIHGLGASDGYIAARFAARTTLLAGLGGVYGALLALPVLVILADLAAPFAAGAISAGSPETIGAPATLLAGFLALPQSMWLALPALPVAAAAIGWLTTQSTVRQWLRSLP